MLRGVLWDNLAFFDGKFTWKCIVRGAYFTLDAMFGHEFLFIGVKALRLTFYSTSNTPYCCLCV